MATTDDEGKMSFLEHLGELRTRIIWSLIPTAVFILIAFRFSDKVLLYLRRPLDKVDVKLVALTPTEAFWTSMKISMVMAVFMAMPVIATFGEGAEGFWARHVGTSTRLLSGGSCSV